MPEMIKAQDIATLIPVSFARLFIRDRFFSRIMKELKNHVKLVELDLEKRLILLENSIDSMQKTVGGIEQFEVSKDAVSQISEIKNVLREIEDTNLISKLETIGNSDKLISVSESVETLTSKMQLLSDAIDIISESKYGKSESREELGKEVPAIKAEIESIKKALSKVSSSIIDPIKISELSTKVESLEKAGSSVNSEFKKMYEAYNEKIGLLERRISTVSAAPAVSQNISKEEASTLKEDVNRIKGINKRLVEMIEIDSKRSTT